MKLHITYHPIRSEDNKEKEVALNTNSTLCWPCFNPVKLYVLVLDVCVQGMQE